MKIEVFARWGLGAKGRVKEMEFSFTPYPLTFTPPLEKLLLQEV